MLITVKASLHGGPFDGLNIELPEGKPEIILSSAESGQPVRHRYVFSAVDDYAVHHYYVPTLSPPAH
jgi:hypothetical protein